MRLTMPGIDPIYTYNTSTTMTTQTLTKWPPPRGMSEKLYQCGNCRAEFKTTTNHWGDIYTCPKCGSTSRSICIEPPPPGYARPAVPTVDTRIHHYRFNVRDAKERQAWEELQERLQATNGRCFEGNRQRNEKLGTWVEPITLETNYLFDNQWNSTTSRVFDWYLGIDHGTPDIKAGHWLEITDEMRALRHTTQACGYCGHQEPTSTGHLFHHECMSDPHLQETKLHLLRMLRIDAGKDRLALTEAERAQLLPLYVAAQTTATSERHSAARARQQAAILTKFESQLKHANTERAGMLWLWEHEIDLENVIYYDHTGRFGFGWRSPLSPAVVEALRVKLAEFPFQYDLK
jgi:DNA-directed RNA polymerase subunit RPC12/RpoP